MTKMKPEIKTKWIERLRSGQDEQGRGSLRTEDGAFCCLGVLCEVARESGVEMEILPQVSYDEYDDAGFRDGDQRRSPEGIVYALSNDDYNWEVLPITIVDWAGLDSVNPSVEVEGEKMDLARINDGGASFEEIANLIEENL